MTMISVKLERIHQHQTNATDTTAAIAADEVWTSHPRGSGQERRSGEFKTTIKLRQFKYLLRFIAILLVQSNCSLGR